METTQTLTNTVQVIEMDIFSYIIAPKKREKLPKSKWRLFCDRKKTKKDSCFVQVTVTPGEGTLTFSNLDIHDAGEYVCMVSFFLFLSKKAIIESVAAENTLKLPNS